MIFGAEIDDDFFEQPREKVRGTDAARTAKICIPKWFLETSVTSTDKEEVLKCLRYKADYLYSMKEYLEASKTYDHCLELLPSSNLPATRECMEGLSRSLLHHGQPDKALEWALKMHAAAVGCDQKVASWNLLATVCHTLGKYEEELEALHCCLGMHKSNPDFWLRLAYCYSGLFKISLPNSGCKFTSPNFCCDFKLRTFIPIGDASSSESVDTKELCDETKKQLVKASAENTNNEPLNENLGQLIEKCEMCSLSTQVISACLLRTRILSNSNNQSAISKRKVAQTNDKVTMCLAHMEVDQFFIDEASKMLKSEIYANSAAKKSDLDAQQNLPTKDYAQDKSEVLISQGQQSLEV